MTRWVPLAGVLAVLVGMGACRDPRPRADSTAKATEPPAPTQTMDHFSLQDLRDGKQAMTLDAEKARLFETDQYAEVEKPVVVFFEAGQASSRMIAPQGRVNLMTHDMEAWGGVTLVTADSATLTTERLQYDPKRRKIFSNNPVRLVRPDSETEGQGLESDPELRVVTIKQQKVRLKKNAGM